MAAIPVVFAKNVTTAGTRVALSATTLTSKEVVVQAKPSNTGTIYLGGSAVASTAGICLAPGESFNFANLMTPAHQAGGDVDFDMSQIYIDSSVNGEGVFCLYTVR